MRQGCVIVYSNMAGKAIDLRRIRKARGLSLRALADKVGMSYVALYHLEAGHAGPRLSTLRALAKALGVTVGEIIGERRPAKRRAGRRT